MGKFENLEHSKQSTSNVEQVDAVVVGLGVLGLMLAKRLTDFGQRVVAIESSRQVATGPSSKNHGWLHTGIVHALSVPDQDEQSGRELAKKLQYGHKFFTTYAPECIDQPFDPTYAITVSEEIAAKARKRWTEYGIPYQEIDKGSFIRDVEPGLNPEMANFFFENRDTRINNRLLFMKLLTDIQSRGATVLRAAAYGYEDESTISVTPRGGDSLMVNSPLFFYATGPNLDMTYQKLTGESLGMDYWKSHLLLMPRIVEKSIVSVDKDSPIIINHGDTSVVNRGYDDVRIREQDYTVDPKEVERAYDRLVAFYPKAAQYKDDIQATACLKPNISTEGSSTTRHSVRNAVYEPVDGHIFALPGKMTEAPYVADSLVRSVADKLDLKSVSMRPLDHFTMQP